MNNQKLPNVTAILVLGISSILLCWCYGILGIVLSIIALFLVRNTTKLYEEHPEDYTNYETLKAGKIVAIVGLILNVVLLVLFAGVLYAIGLESIMSQDQELIQERMNDIINS